MKIISQDELSALALKTEFRDFKRIANKSQVSAFYNLCCKNLLTNIEWNKLNLYYPISNISISDQHGFKINRAMIIGDIIEVSYHPTSDFNSSLFLKIDNLKHDKGDEDELFEIGLKVNQKPNLGRFYSYLNYQSTCKIKARRIINTISVEAKINLTSYPNPYLEENNNMIAQFPWDRLIKNTLSKL